MDGLESASSVDHKSISPFFERQSLIANVVSSSPKAADTLSEYHFDERINYETTNLGLETDENLKSISFERRSCILIKDANRRGEESDGSFTPDKNFDECINDEMANLGLETNENTCCG
ncbi:hypothetical protein Tco_1389943 [Tanacetum coccineum]